MKTRSGFVSNSSSSSFIVALKRGMSKQELRETLFGDERLHGSYGREYRVEDLMDTIWHDYEEQAGLHFFDDEAKLVDEMCSGYYEGYPKCPVYAISKMSDDERWIAYEVYNKVNKATAEERLREFMFQKVFCERRDLFAFIFEYADETSFGSALEHGGIFDMVPSLRISKH